MSRKPWRSLGESNPSFQIEKLTPFVETKGLSCKTHPKRATGNSGRPEQLQNNTDTLAFLRRSGGVCPVCTGSGWNLKSPHPFRCVPCWMCAGRMYFGWHWYEPQHPHVHGGE